MKFKGMKVLALAAVAALTVNVFPAFASSADEPEAKTFRLLSTQTANGEGKDGGWMYNTGITLADYGSNGLKLSNAAGGEAVTQWAFPAEMIFGEGATPYLVYEIDKEQAKQDNATLPSMSLLTDIIPLEGKQQFHASGSIAPNVLTNCIDLRAAYPEIKDPADYAGAYVYVKIYVVSEAGTASSIPFNKLYLSNRKETINLPLTGAHLNDAEYPTNGGYYAAEAGMTFDASVAEGLKIDCANETEGPGNMVFWAFHNSYLDKMPYLVYELAEGSKDNLADFFVTKKYGLYDEMVKRTITTEDGVSYLDIKALMEEDETLGWFYLGIGLKASSSVTFNQLYLSNTVPATANVTALTEAIDAAKALDLAQYIDGAEKDAFKAALKAAEEVLGNSKATQKQVDTAAADLVAKQKALIKSADTFELEKTVRKLSKLTPAAYTSASYQPLKAKLEEAQKLLGGNTLKQADADTMVKELLNLQKNLEAQANGTYFRLIPKQSATPDNPTDGGWYVENPGMSYQDFGKLGISMSYDGSNSYGFSGAMYAVSKEQVEKTPYFVFEIAQDPSLKTLPSFSLIIGYSPNGNDRIEVMMYQPINQVNGCYAINVKELLKDYKDVYGYYYISLNINSTEAATINFLRLYMSSSAKEKSDFSIHFLPENKGDEGCAEGYYYSIASGLKVEGLADNGLKMTAGTDSDGITYAFPKNYLNFRPYFYYDTDDISKIESITIHSPFDGEASGKKVTLKTGLQKVDMREILKDNKLEVGYFYVTIRFKAGETTFNSLYISDAAGAQGPNVPQTGVETNVLLWSGMLALSCAAAFVFGVKRRRNSR